MEKYLLVLRLILIRPLVLEQSIQEKDEITSEVLKVVN